MYDLHSSLLVDHESDYQKECLTRLYILLNLDKFCVILNNETAMEVTRLTSLLLCNILVLLFYDKVRMNYCENQYNLDEM
jgi:hypothetical protein